MSPIQNTILRLLDAVKDSQDFERIITNARLTANDFEDLTQEFEELDLTPKDWQQDVDLPEQLIDVESWLSNGKANMLEDKALYNLLSLVLQKLDYNDRLNIEKLNELMPQPSIGSKLPRRAVITMLNLSHISTDIRNAVNSLKLIEDAENIAEATDYAQDSEQELNKALGTIDELTGGFYA